MVVRDAARNAPLSPSVLQGSWGGMPKRIAHVAILVPDYDVALISKGARSEG